MSERWASKADQTDTEVNRGWAGVEPVGVHVAYSSQFQCLVGIGDSLALASRSFFWLSGSPEQRQQLNNCNAVLCWGWPLALSFRTCRAKCDQLQALPGKNTHRTHGRKVVVYARDDPGRAMLCRILCDDARCCGRTRSPIARSHPSHSMGQRRCHERAC